MAKPTRFTSRPFPVKGFKVTEENMEAVAHWCEGHIVETAERKFIRVPVQNARSNKQTEAIVDCWVLRSRRNGRNSFKVYDEEWLLKNFVESPLDEVDEHDDEIVIHGEKDNNRVTNNVRPLPTQRTNKSSRLGAI